MNSFSKGMAVLAAVQPVLSHPGLDSVSYIAPCITTLLAPACLALCVCLCTPISDSEF